MKKFKWYLALVFLMGICLPGRAQPDEENFIRKEISFLIWEDVEATLWVRSEQTLVPLQNISPYRRSIRIDYYGPATLRIFATPEPPLEVTPEPVEITEELNLEVFTPVGSLQINPELKQPLILLIPDARNVTNLKGTAFEDHPSDFPYGSFKFFNVTNRELIGKLGDQDFQIEPGRARLIEPNKTTNGVLEFVLGYRNQSGTYELAEKTIYSYRIRRREIRFIKEHPNKPGAFHTLSVVEYESAAKPEEN